MRLREARIEQISIWRCLGWRRSTIRECLERGESRSKGFRLSKNKKKGDERKEKRKLVAGKKQKGGLRQIKGSTAVKNKGSYWSNNKRSGVEKKVVAKGGREGAHAEDSWRRTRVVVGTIEGARGMIGYKTGVKEIDSQRTTHSAPRGRKERKSSEKQRRRGDRVQRDGKRSGENSARGKPRCTFWGGK